MEQYLFIILKIKNKLKNLIFGIQKKAIFLFLSNILFYSCIRYNNFVEKPNLSEKCCLLVASKKNHDEEGGRSGHEAKLCKKSYDLFSN